QVQYHLLQALTVGKCLGTARIALYLDSRLSGQVCQPLYASIHALVYVDLAALYRLGGVEARQVEQGIGEAPHLLRGFQAGADRFAVFGLASRSREGGLRLGNDDSQGCAQFVRSVGCEALLLREGTFESGKSGIEHTGEAAQLTIFPRHLDSLRKITA